MVRENGPGCHDVYADTLVGIVERSDSGQADDSRFCSDVSGQVRDAVKSSDGSHVYNGSPTRLEHRRDLILHAQKCSANVRADALIEVCGIDFGEGCREGTVRRVVKGR